MDDHSMIQIILLISLLLGACYCAASEIAFASLNTIRIKNESKKGNKRASNVMKIVNSFDKTLVTLLIGNNLAHVGFASLITLMAKNLLGIGFVKYATLFTTIILFFVSELVPKSYAKANSEKFALKVSGSLLALVRIFSPIAKAFTIINRLLEKVLPDKKEDDSMTDEELIDIIEVAHAEGCLDDEETDLVKKAIQFEEKKVRDILIELDNVKMIDINEDSVKIVEELRECGYSRIPVYSENREQVAGILQTPLYLKRFLINENTKIEKLMHKPIVSCEDELINDLLMEMSNKKFHMAIVKDAKNKTIGIVTLEDILEELVGEIWDENDVGDRKVSRYFSKREKELVMEVVS